MYLQVLLYTQNIYTKTHIFGNDLSNTDIHNVDKMF